MKEIKVIERKTAIILLLIFIIVGGYLRIANLNKYSFWMDEFRHVYAAKGIIDTGKPVYPSGLLYTRSIIYTYIVSLFFKFLGISETAARLPSVVLGILMTLLTYYIVSRFLNRNIGIISAFLVAFSPFFILWSRICRMYSLFQPLYLLSAFYFFKAFEESDELEALSLSFSTIKKYLIFIIIYFLAFSVHDQSILLIPTIFVYLVSMCIIVYLKYNLSYVLKSKYFIGCVFALIAGLLVLLFQLFVLKEDLLGFISQAPGWAQTQANNFNFYRWKIQETYPVFSYFYPVALLMLILKKPKIGLFVGSCFIVPFAALSFIFAWKDYRYMFFIFPFFLIPIAFFIENILYYSWRLLKRLSLTFFSEIPSKSHVKIVFVRYIVLISILYPLILPWIKIPQDDWYAHKYNFHTVGDFIKHVDENDLVICIEPFFIEFYSNKKPDFIIKTLQHSRKSLFDKDGSEIDPEGGIPFINNLGELKLSENDNKNIWIITKNAYFRSPWFSEDIVNHIKYTYKRHPVSGNVFEVFYKQGSS